MTTAVALFIFNRPSTTARVFARIADAKPTRLFIVADGPRSERERERVAAARALTSAIDWDCDVHRNFADTNMGLGTRFKTGVDWVFEHAPQAIILEDDCLPEPSFFPFCYELLDRYRDDKRICAISGSNFQLGRSRTAESYYFSRYPHIWGWATWRDRWTGVYDPRIPRWPELRSETWLLDLLGDRRKAAFWRDRFNDIHKGRINTWDYQWVFAAWLARRICVTPDVNLISNIGFGPAATFTTGPSPLADLPTRPMAFPLRHPSAVAINDAADAFSGELCFYATMPRAKAWLRRNLLRIFGATAFRRAVAVARRGQPL